MSASISKVFSPKPANRNARPKDETDFPSPGLVDVICMTLGPPFLAEN